MRLYSDISSHHQSTTSRQHSTNCRYVRALAWWPTAAPPTHLPPSSPRVSLIALRGHARPASKLHPSTSALSTITHSTLLTSRLLTHARASRSLLVSNFASTDFQFTPHLVQPLVQTIPSKWSKQVGLPVTGFHSANRPAEPSQSLLAPLVASDR